MSALPDKWLVVRLSALGDVVLTTGVLSHLSATRGWKFHFLTKAPNAPVLEGHPAIEKLVMPEDDGLDGAAWIKACWRLAKQYEGCGLLDLHGTLRSKVLARVWRGPVRQYPKMSLLRRAHSLTRSEWSRKRLERLNVPQRYALAVEDKAPATSALRPVIHLSAEELEYGVDLIEQHGATGPVCAIHPYATHPGKQWPVGHWEALCGLLHMTGWQTLVLGRDPAPLFAQDPPEGVVDLTNTTDLRQTCSVLCQCKALVTNDSGPMHLGTAVGTKVVALFGPTTRAWGFYPSGERDHVLESDMACRPCSLHGGKGCSKDEACMAEIDPEEVAREVVRP